MMADSTGKVTSGSPFRAPPATIWNNMIDAGQAVADEKLNSGPPGATRSRATDLLKLKNSSGAVRRKGEILKIEGKVIETVTDENIWLDGIEPTAECRFGILKSPANMGEEGDEENGEVITAQVSGVCLALVNVTDASHTFASAVDADYVLHSGTSGPLEILYAPDGTGELECVVRFCGGPGLKLFVALEDFSTGGHDVYATNKGFTSGICAELKFDRNLIEGSDETYLRIDGWTTVVFNPISRESSGGDECGFGEIPCGQRFFATFSGVSGRWERVSGGVSSAGLITCNCVNYGYSLWDIVDDEWVLVENRCSGCYDATAIARPYIPPALRFEETAANADWLQPPTIDPVAADASREPGQLFVKCCYPDGEEPPDDFCQCCYEVSLEFTVQKNSDPAVEFSDNLLLGATGTSLPCHYQYSYTVTDSTGVGIGATGSVLNLYVNRGGVQFSLNYTGPGGDMDCDGSKNYTFDSGFAWIAGGGSPFIALTSESDTIELGGDDYTYEFPASISLTVNEDCIPPDPPPTGRCCSYDEMGDLIGCDETTEAACDGADQTWTDGIDCDDACPDTNEPIGRCCYFSAESGDLLFCEEVTEAECVGDYVTWTEGEVCDDCPPSDASVGRCCYDMGGPVCTENTAAECDLFTGSSWTVGLNCIDDPCP
jgi:hypothetical protein